MTNSVWQGRERHTNLPNTVIGLIADWRIPGSLAGKPPAGTRSYRGYHHRCIVVGSGDHVHLRSAGISLGSLDSVRVGLRVCHNSVSLLRQTCR